MNNPNKTTLVVYQHPFGIAPRTVLDRGSGNFSRTAPVPNMCVALGLNEGEQAFTLCQTRMMKVYDAITRRKKVIVCNRKEVDDWFAAHTKSKLYPEWEKAKEEAERQDLTSFSYLDNVAYSGVKMGCNLNAPAKNY